LFVVSRTRGAIARAQADRRSAELAAAAGQAVHTERLAVARDLHDVVSHAISVIVVQAGAAQALYPIDPARARAALGVVDQTANETLTELDRLVLAIGDGVMGAALPSSVGAVAHDEADLRALVQRMRRAGLRIDLTLDDSVTGDTATACYRIVQETLTNVVRHAPGARVWVTIDHQAVGTTVDVTDDGPGPATDSQRGYGLVGIAERVERFGGKLQAGPGPDGTGFRVHARLPSPTVARP
jgi:signal transduction histidine kinase